MKAFKKKIYYFTKKIYDTTYELDVLEKNKIKKINELIKKYNSLNSFSSNVNKIELELFKLFTKLNRNIINEKSKIYIGILISLINKKHKIYIPTDKDEQVWKEFYGKY